MTNLFQQQSQHQQQQYAAQQQQFNIVQQNMAQQHQAQLNATQALTTAQYDIRAQQEDDQLFKDILVFDGTNKSLFLEWTEALEVACFKAKRNIISIAYLKSAGAVRISLSNVPRNARWSDVKAELMRNYSDIPTLSHAATHLCNIKQYKDESTHSFTLRYGRLHTLITNKEPKDQTDADRIIHFLSSLRNESIASKISQYDNWKYPRNLQQAFGQATEIEAALQRAEGVNLLRTGGPQVMAVDINEVDDDRMPRQRHQPYQHRQTQRRGSRPTTQSCLSRQVEIEVVEYLEDMAYQLNEMGVEINALDNYVCWYCGQIGHMQTECPEKQAGHPRKYVRGPKIKSTGKIIGDVTYIIEGRTPLTEEALAMLVKDSLFRTVAGTPAPTKKTFVKKTTGNQDAVGTTAGTTQSGPAITTTDILRGITKSSVKQAVTSGQKVQTRAQAKKNGVQVSVIDDPQLKAAHDLIDKWKCEAIVEAIEERHATAIHELNVHDPGDYEQDLEAGAEEGEA